MLKITELMYYRVMREEIVYFQNDDLQRRKSFIEMTGISHCDGSYYVQRRNSPYYAIEYILSGRGYLHIDGRDFEPHHGDVYLLHKGSDHKYGSFPEDPWVKIWVAFGGPVADILFEELGLNGIYLIRNCDIEDELRNIYDTSKRHVHAGHFHKESAVLIHELLYRIHTFVYPISEEIAAPLEAAVAYMRMHIHRSISMVEIGRHAGKSSSQLARLFKQRFGKTPCEYFLDIKMERAKILLAESSLLIRQVAENLGFCDAFHFSKTFKKVVGMSPNSYREANL